MMNVRWQTEKPDPRPTVAVTMRSVAETVAARHGMTLDDLRANTRQHYIAHRRQEAMAAIYATGLFSNLQIARFFGLKDHTTVIHARQAHERRMAEGRAA